MAEGMKKLHLHVHIRPVTPADIEVVYPFQCEYLDRETSDEWRTRVEANPGMYLAAYDGEQLAGICYGHPSRREAGTAVLQGIAVNLDRSKPYARAGIGSRLLRAFEQEAASRGFRKIGVGSADDARVESFYRANGYQAVELVAKDAAYRELERQAVLHDDPEQAERQKERLQKKHDAAEVIYIFDKGLSMEAL